MAAVIETAEGVGLAPSADGGRDILRRHGQPVLLCALLADGPDAPALPCGKGPTAAGVALLRLRAAASLSMVGDGGSGSSIGWAWRVFNASSGMSPASAANDASPEVAVGVVAAIATALSIRELSKQGDSP